MAITNGYATLADFQAWAGVTSPTAAEDSRGEMAVMAASRMVDEHTGRFFWTASAVTKYATPVAPDLLLVDDLVSVTTLKTDDDGDGVFETTWAASTDFYLAPRNNAVAYPVRPFWEVAVAPGGRYAFIPGRRWHVQIVGTWGWAAVPEMVKLATLIQATRLYKRKDAPFGAAGSSQIAGPILMKGDEPMDGDAVRLLAGFVSATNGRMDDGR